MVVPTPNYPIHNEKINDAIELPTIDLSCSERSEVSRLIVKACEEFGFFKVINHGVPKDIITKMEQESLNFFAKPMAEKQLAGPAKPFGYGCKNIGFNGDTGDVEYILLNTNPLSISHCSKIISNNPTSFSCAVSWYIEAVKGLACEILDLMGDGLLMSDRKLFSKLINHTDNDSLFRLNHYPNPNINTDHHDHHHHHYHHHHSFKVGFGEHSDPQILTLLRSNDVGGLQISLQDKVWVPVPPDPTAFLVNVGDVLQAMTNGRFVSVRHRVTNSYNNNSNNNNKSRMSMAYFAAPPLNAWIRAPTEVVAQDKPCLFRPFTWAEYKRTAYSLRLNENRLNLFIVSKDCDDIIKETIYNI